MSRTSTAGRLPAAVLAALLVGASALAGFGASPAHAATRTLVMSVSAVSQTTPAATVDPKRLTVTLRLKNTGTSALSGLTVIGTRATPINNQQALDQAIARPQPPDPQFSAPITPIGDTPVHADVKASSSTTVTYVTQTSTIDGLGICLCANAIYPLYFAVYDAAGVQLATAQTYLSAFGLPVTAKTTVSWLWPIIGRPHRVAGTDVFVDDDLTTSVESGRLRRLLDVLVDLAELADPPAMTVLVDPEIIDELAIMRSGYRVETSPGASTTRPGTGGTAAGLWLDEFQSVLAGDSHLQLAFTPPADPNVAGLTVHGLPWSGQLPAADAARVSEALGGRDASTSIALPFDPTLATKTAEAFRRHGASTLVLPSSALTAGSLPTQGVEFAKLSTAAGAQTVAVLPAQTQRWVSAALGTNGPTALPSLVAQVAIRAASYTHHSTDMVIAAPRYVDPDVANAVRAIRATTEGQWATTATVMRASLVRTSDIAVLAPNTRGSGMRPDAVQMATAAISVENTMSAIQAGGGTSDVLTTLPAAVQRAESNGWVRAPDLATIAIAQLNSSISALQNAVHIVKPSTGTYTLASANSPLPLTVVNTLPFAVRVRVSVEPVSGVPGISSKEGGERTIAAGQTITFKVPMTVERTGRFLVSAQLLTPQHTQLGEPVQLTVHSTALGRIGVIITVAAGVLLVVALLLRVWRQLRRRHATGDGSAT